MDNLLTSLLCANVISFFFNKDISKKYSEVLDNYIWKNLWESYNIVKTDKKEGFHCVSGKFIFRKTIVGGKGGVSI